MLGNLPSENQWINEPFMAAENGPEKERNSPSQKDLRRLSRNFENIEFDFNNGIPLKKNHANEFCDQITEQGSCADSIEEFLMTPVRASPFPSEKGEPFERRLGMLEEGDNADDIRSFASSHEEAEEVDFGQFKGFFNANPASSSDSNRHEGLSSSIGSIDMAAERSRDSSLPDARKVYKTESTGTKSNFPMFIFNSQTQHKEELASVGLKKAIKKTNSLKRKKQKRRTNKKKVKSTAKTSKKTPGISLFKRIMNEPWKKSSLAEQNLSLNSLILKSKKVNENAGIHMNKLLQNYMKCIEEDIRHTRLVERRKEIVKKKQEQMMRILQKREVIHQKIEKVFRE